MLNWAPLVLALVMIFVFERPGEKESRIVSGLLYFLLGIFPINLAIVDLHLGIPVALLLSFRRVDHRGIKIAAALLGALAGWIYFTYYRVGGA